MERFFKRPWIIIMIILGITVFFALQLPRAQFDNNNFRFVPKDDPARIASSQIDKVFGSQIFIMVGLQRSYDTILDADFLTKLRIYGEKVKELPVVDEVNSIITTDYIGGQADGITVEALVPETFTGTAEEIALVQERLLAWDLYQGSLFSDDFKSTQVLVSLALTAETAGSPESVEAYLKIKSMAEEMDFKDTRIYTTGMPVFSADINEATSADLRTLIPLVAIVVLLTLFLSFRKLSGVILPMLTVAISAVWSLGAMVLFGVKLSIISTVLPVILVAVGSAYGIHVISHYYDDVVGRGILEEEEYRRRLFIMLRRVGRPVFLAALTTFVGFGSLSFTSVVPIAEFGIFASLGVLVAFISAVTVIPALFIIQGPEKNKNINLNKQEKGKALMEDPLSGAIADAFGAVAKKRRSVLGLTFILVVFSIVGITQIIIDNVMIEYFKKDAEVVQSDSFIREYFGGSKTLSVIVRGKERGAVLDPSVLSAMDGLATYLMKEVPEVGKAMGFTDLVKRINQVFNVDESPEGIKPAIETAVEVTEDAAFGFGEETSFGFENFSNTGEDATFGFDNSQLGTSFGFSDFDEVEETVVSEYEEAPLSSLAQDREALTKHALMTLLSEAVATGAQSAEELIKVLERKLNYRGASYYEIPTDPAKYGKLDAEGLKALVSNYLVLLSGDIGSFADDPLEPRAIRMSLQLRTLGQQDTDKAIAIIEEYVDRRFPKNVEVEIGGVAMVEGSLNKLVVQSQLTSVISSLILVFIIIAFYYRSAIAGLIGLTPLAVSILINFGVMGLLGIKLNIGTAMVASIAVGVGIDYSIHYMAAYHHEYLGGNRSGELLRRTFLTSGKAIIFNAASVGAGFAVLALSKFNMLAYFGALITLTMATSSIVSLTVLPVLLETIQPAFIRRPLPFEKNQVATEESL